MLTVLTRKSPNVTINNTFLPFISLLNGGFGNDFR